MGPTPPVLLASFLARGKVQAPHATTYSRILGHAVDLVEFERVSQAFFRRQPGADTRVHITLDGKTMRGTIPAGWSHGVHWLAAFLPQEGWVLFQVEVGKKENEIPAAHRIVQALDWRGKIITGDALLAQRELSLAIVEKGGGYLWIIKENQPETHQALAQLFAPEPVVKGFSPASHNDFQTVRTLEKGHGRIELRTLTVSRALNGYLDWPGMGLIHTSARTKAPIARFHRRENRTLCVSLPAGISGTSVAKVRLYIDSSTYCANESLPLP